MYTLIWRALPGPLWLSIVLAVALVCAAWFCLVAWLFPMADRWLYSDSSGTVG
ncbi:DUF4175 domain-containing protein [Subtercola vilae]|uniref:DUF4175 domain-containing protein n=1 Tax=Subtercola vilae TaxID=2056433 RepID=UPI0010AB378C|nr:DUF4175 domain-containing protein [Subtercola vilae]